MHCPPAGAAPDDGPADRPVVVCVHGWGCSAFSFGRVLRPIADAGCDVYAPDLRGHGWSDKPLEGAQYTPEALARWLLAVLDALGIGRAVLVGHSMGGGVALRAAQLAPERIAGLVLLAPAGLGDMPRTRLLRWFTPRLIEPLLPHLARRAVFGVGLRTGFGAIGTPSARDVDEYWAPSADPRFARAARLVAHAFDWRPTDPADLARLPCPVHVMLGERDTLVAGAHVRAHTRSCDGLRIDEVPRAGHVLPEEVPDMVVDAVVRDAHAWWRPSPGAP
ncbi:MAG: alpha/beta fold hydrolase [Gemmatirosa sp.]